MKIAIITQPLEINYGGILQNFALQKVLKRMGVEVETVNWKHYRKDRFMDWLGRNKKTLFHFINKNLPIPPYKLTDKEQRIISQNTNRFVERYISLCPTLVKNPKMFYDIDRKYNYDAYVVGSDQTWRPKYNTMLKSMFLDFVERDNVKRIAFSVSFGSSTWEYSPELTEECTKLAKKFDFVTVREKSGVKLCEDYFGISASNVLDPTMLISSDLYQDAVINENEPQSEGNLFYYILDPNENKRKLIEDVSNLLELKPFTSLPKYPAGNRTRQNVKQHIDDCIYPSVTKWLRGFMDAKMIITDSFHGVVFSILFNKPFWVFENLKRGNARFESLLNLFELKDRYINSFSVSDHKWDSPIDWDKVNLIRKKEIERSLTLLQNAIKG